LRQPLARTIAVLLVAFALPTPGLAIQSIPDESQAHLAARIDRPIRNLAIAPEELGPHWQIIPESVQELDIEQYVSPARPTDPLALFQARYRNDVDHEPWRETAVLVAQFQDQRQAETAMREYLNGVVLGGQMPDVRWRWPAEEVAAGDGGYRFGYCFRDDFTAGYLFKTDTYLGGILVRGAATDEDVLLTQATTLASWQEAMLTSGPASARF